MDYKNWLLLLFTIFIAGVFSYSIYGQSVVEEKNEDNPIQVEPSEKIVLSDSSDWVDYSGETIRFRYPEQWKPESTTPFGGAVVEQIKLNIPGASDDNVSYTVTSMDMIKPDDIVEEDDIVINDRSWKKWVRKGENYVSYDIYTKDDLNVSEAESFGIHVTLEEENKEIEEELITLTSTIEFVSSESGSLEENPIE